MSTLTDEQTALLPTEADVAFYTEHGYWISPVILPGEVLDAADRGMARYYAGDLDSPGVHPDDWRPSPGDGLRKDDYASRSVTELAALVAEPILGATAAVLSGAARRGEGIRLWHDQLLFKPVDRAGLAANVGWHTDRQYWTCCSSEQMLTAWVGFHDVEPAGGSVGFFEGSHRWDVTGTDFFGQDLGALEDTVRGQGFDPRIVPVTMRRGQVSFHHCRTVHGSGPNHGSEPRRALAVHLQPTDNRAAVAPDGALPHHHNNDLARGTAGWPAYSDERWFPLLCPARAEDR